jgi:hypothetical protein
MSLGRHRGHLTLLAIVAALVLSACGGSSSSSSSKSSTSGSAVASATTSTKAAAKHGNANKKHTKVPSRHAHGGSPPPPPAKGAARRRIPAAQLKLLRANPLGAAFSVGDGTFTRYVYRPLVSVPAGNKTQQRFTLLRANAATGFVQHSLLAASQQAKRQTATASLSAGLVSMATQAISIQKALAKGQRPTSAVQSLEAALKSMAAELKARGVKLFLQP